MKQFYVYIHKKPDGTPFYVGKSGTNRHKTVWRKHNPHHTNIVKKYGPENIIVDLTNCASEQDAFNVEKIYIKQLREAGYKLCNLTDGGDGVGGFKRSEAQKVLISNMKQGNTYRKGSSQTEVANEKNRQAHLGKKQSKETVNKRVQKISKLRKVKTGIAGVYWYKSQNCWVAKISPSVGSSAYKHLGYFENYLDACAARKSAENAIYKQPHA